MSLGGVSWAVATGSIDSREIKNETSSRTQGHLRNNEVRGVDIRNSTIGGRDVALNTLAGADISETTLARCPTPTTLDGVDRRVAIVRADSHRRSCR